MSRSIAGVLACVAAIIIFWPPLARAATENPRRPNILFIITDQQHAGMMSCAGNRYLKTPAMDSLARNGTRFERAYCVNPVCVPSRVGMLAGVMPSRIGMEDNADMGRAKVSDGILRASMGRVFRDAGYETVYGGKVHTPMKLDDMGFELFTTDQREKLAEDCAAYLRRPHDRPFLLVASFINPHDICYMAIQDHARSAAPKEPGKAATKGKRTQGAEKAAPAATKASPANALEEALKLPAGMSREEFFRSVCPPLPANFEVPPGEPGLVSAVDPRSFRFYVRQHWSDQRWREHRWAYCRLTERVDAQIGQVLEALRQAGLEQNTLVIFTSDHGDMDSAHRLEHKSVLYEEATRVPFVVRRPGVTKAGTVDKEHLVSTGLDLIPTMCDFAGITPPASLPGKSVRALVEGRPAAWRQTLVVESNRCRCVRGERFKYTVYDSLSPREVLIDLENDPGEMKSLAGDPAHRQVLESHRKLLQEWYRTNGETLDAKYIVQ